MPVRDTQIRYCFFCRQWERDSGSPLGWVKIGRAEGMTVQDRQRVEVLVGNIIVMPKPTQEGLVPALALGGLAQ